jgi:hypothetical protein
MGGICEDWGVSVIDEPVNIASAAFLRALAGIEAGVWGTPCAVELVDGRIFDVALAWENRRFGDAGKWINPQAVVTVSVCLKRMPPQFAQLIHRAGESGMGYHLYVVALRDGSSFVHVAGNLGIDLVNLPAGYTSDDIIAVHPHEGRERSREEGYRSNEGVVSVEYARPSDGVR